MTGDLHPFAERPVKVSNFWFPVNLPPGETTLLLRIKTTSTLYVPLYFSTYNASASQHEAERAQRRLLRRAVRDVLLQPVPLRLAA